MNHININKTILSFGLGMSSVMHAASADVCPCGCNREYSFIEAICGKWNYTERYKENKEMYITLFHDCVNKRCRTATEQCEWCGVEKGQYHKINCEGIEKYMNYSELFDCKSCGAHSSPHKKNCVEKLRSNCSPCWSQDALKNNWDVFCPCGCGREIRKYKDLCNDEACKLQLIAVLHRYFSIGDAIAAGDCEWCGVPNGEYHAKGCEGLQYLNKTAFKTCESCGAVPHMTHRRNCANVQQH